MSSGDLWYVKLADGDVHRVTLDQLDEAFQGGHIDENTMVLAAGATKWITLGQAAGLEGDTATVPAAPRAPVPAAAPSAFKAAPVAAPTAQPAPVPRTAAIPITTVLPQAPAARPAYANPNSIRPVSVDLGEAGDLDFDAPFRRGRSRKKWIFGGVLLSALGAAGTVAAIRPDVRARLSSLAGTGQTSEVAAAAVIAPPPPPMETPPAPAPAPPAQPPVAAANSPDTSGGSSPLSPRFTDQQRQKLLAADKQHEQKGHAHTSTRANSASAPAPARSKSSGVFTTGGNKFDPLNSSI